MKVDKKGWKIESSYIVIAVVAFSQGVLGLSDLAISFMQKENYHMQPSEMTYIQGIISFPWQVFTSSQKQDTQRVIKPIWGLCTDMLPIFSYRRKSYLFLFGILSFILWNALAEYGVNDKWLGISILLGIQICVSFCNVVGEALLVEVSGTKNSNSDGQKATKNVSLFFGIKATGTLITAYFSGYSLKYLTKQQIFKVTSVFPLLMALIALTLNEEKVTILRNGKNNKQSTVNSHINQKETIQNLKKFLNQPAIFRPILFIFFFMLTPSQSTAMFYFYTVQLGFTSEFLGYMRFLQAFGNIASVIFFNHKLKKVPFKKIFGISTLSYCLCSSLTLILVTRFQSFYLIKNQRENVKLGINDRFFCLADTILIHIIAELNTLPILILACNICPKNIEGTMYALLMSTINLGQLLGKQIGGILMVLIGITDKNFENLWQLVLVHTIYIVLPLPFLFTVEEKAMLDAKKKRDIQDVEKCESDQMFVERHQIENKLSLSSIAREDEFEKLLE